MKKRFMCVLLAVLMICSLSISVLAESISDFSISNKALDKEVASITQEILQYSVEPNKKGFGMEDVDFSNLKLGGRFQCIDYVRLVRF